MDYSDFEDQKVIIAWGDENNGVSLLCGRLEKFEHIKRAPLVIQRNLISSTTLNQDTFLFVVDGEERELKPPLTVMINPEVDTRNRVTKEQDKVYSVALDRWSAWEDGWQAGLHAAQTVRSPGGFKTRENPYLEEHMDLMSAAFSIKRDKS